MSVATFASAAAALTFMYVGNVAATSLPALELTVVVALPLLLLSLLACGSAQFLVLSFGFGCGPLRVHSCRLLSI